MPRASCASKRDGCLSRLGFRERHQRRDERASCGKERPSESRKERRRRGLGRARRRRPQADCRGRRRRRRRRCCGRGRRVDVARGEQPSMRRRTGWSGAGCARASARRRAAAVVCVAARAAPPRFVGQTSAPGAAAAVAAFVQISLTYEASVASPGARTRRPRGRRHRAARRAPPGADAVRRCPQRSPSAVWSRPLASSMLNALVLGHVRPLGTPGDASAFTFQTGAGVARAACGAVAVGAAAWRLGALLGGGGTSGARALFEPRPCAPAPAPRVACRAAAKPWWQSSRSRRCRAAAAAPLYDGATAAAAPAAPRLRAPPPPPPSARRARDQPA